MVETDQPMEDVIDDLLQELIIESSNAKAFENFVLFSDQ